jgi:peptide/nickel transport system ATP-binding protein
MTQTETQTIPPLLQARQVTKRFRLRWPNRGVLTAFAEVDLAVWPGETVALVGESGSGKTTLSRCLLGLLPVDAGVVQIGGVTLAQASREEWRSLRRLVQPVFQDPASSLNPRQSAGAMLTEPLTVHGLCAKHERRARAEALLTQVGLDASAFDRKPHAFSAGQRQRLAIARALSVEPKLLIADEPLSALDASVRAQIQNLLADLRQSLGLSVLLIVHDLGLAERVSQRAYVMLFGRIVEQGPTPALFTHPRHHYTRALLLARPNPALLGQHRAPLPALGPGEPPSPLAPPPGCAFASRCASAQPRCHSERPLLTPVSPEHAVACHFPG